MVYDEFGKKEGMMDCYGWMRKWMKDMVGEYRDKKGMMRKDK